MAVFKVTWVFNAGRQGWTETTYQEWANQIGSAGFSNLLKKWAVERDKLVGKAVSLEAVKYSDVTAPRLGILIDYSDTLGGVSGDPGDDSRLADQAGACAELILRTAAGDRRVYQLRGVPDNWILRGTASGLVSLSNDGESAVNAYATALQKAGFLRLKLRKKPGTADDATHTLSFKVANIQASADPTTTGLYLVTTVGNHPFVALDKVVLSGAKGVNVSRALGVHTVVSSPSATTFVINAQPNIVPAIVNYEGGGTVRRLDYYYSPVTSIVRGRVSFRKTGRALFVPRGRRRVPR